ncbi:insulinase family protein [Candidatus Chloroploca sp. M-50]|uniref:Insulinase family protein n=1 Tax=Candidatus Chloroploca mongolica TaxID=2528176 RepID=A0ABS4D5L9_9CHLR|nr:insulinase family protein [Candidatus Chloroploca mongolica]MBP1464720.1 insulinase family protein [Candidatus Chloroploca mongolica]
MTRNHGFELLRDEQITELNTRARLYRHTRTGAELLSLECDDENKCFGITFRTPPSDHTGIAHILEHSVLCGSRKYPVKKPFFELIKSSVKTFLNAMTYPDKTTYPVASTNLADFYHLVDVYLDAVFFPRITPEVLKQEGWHYELTRKDEPLSFHGVVFNEMKGQYSSPDYLLYRTSQAALFPATTYGMASGGDPKYIPDLTFEAFQNFHTTLYHPSNARIYFYGDDDPERRLELLDEYLAQFEALPIPSEVALQPRFPEPRIVEETYTAPSEESSKKGMVTINWMIGEEADETRVLAMAMLSYLLLGTPAAPLYKALTDSGLGDSLTGGGYNDGLRQHTFSVGLKGIDPTDASAIEDLVLTTLQRLADEGFDADQLASALNTVEFSLRENNTGGFPRGLSIMLRALDTWLYDGDPLAPLRFETPLATIKAALTNGERIFEDLIRRTLLENTHRVRVMLRPDPEQAARDAAEERARLDAVQATLNDQDLEQIIADTQALKILQETPDRPEDLARIPTLTLGDLDRQSKTIPTARLTSAEVPLLYHDLFTNGIVYLDLTFDLRAVPAHLLGYVPLFARALTEMGTANEDFVRLVQRIGRDTGGIYASTSTSTHLQTGEPLGHFVIRGKATVAQTEAMLALMRDILLTVNLNDRERFRQIATRSRAMRESALVPSGNAFARKRILARLAPAEWADEQLGGISALFFVRQLVQRIDEDWPGVLADLELIRTSLINRSTMVANLTLDEANQRQVEPALAAFLGALPSTTYEPALWPITEAGPGEGLIVPAKVNYVAKAASLYPLGLKVSGAASAITRFMNIGYYLEKVRVQGGAYGVGASFERSTGIFGAVSYRDPHLLKTLAVYDHAGDYLRTVAMDATAIERSIIGTIGDIDGYQLPDAKGYTAMMRHLNGITDAYRQELREQILNATEADFRAFAEILDTVQDHGIIAVVGSAEAIATANREHPGLLNPVNVMG